MKKRISFLIAAVMASVCLLSGCQGKAGADTTAPVKAESSKAGDGAGKETTAQAAGETEAKADPLAAITDDGTKKTITYWHTFTAGLAAGALPDISSVNPDSLFAINQAGAVLPMNPLIDALGDDYFLKKPLANFTDGDTVLGIPYYFHSYLMWYRKDVLEEKNLPVPKSWDELLNTVKAVADPPNRYGFTIAMSKNDQMCAQLLSCFYKSRRRAAHYQGQ